MLGICYTTSAMCCYFREAVLPNDPELEAARKEQTAARVRKFRSKAAM